LNQLQQQKQQEQELPYRNHNGDNDKGVLYRTLNRLANNQYLSCGNNNIDIDRATSSPKKSSSSTLLRCGINRLGSEDDEIDYEIVDNDYDDILLIDNNAKNNNKSPALPKKSSKESRNDRVTKRGRKIRRSATQTKPSKRKISLYRKTMMTAATSNANDDSSTPPPSNEPPAAEATMAQQQQQQQQHLLQNTARFARGFADDAGRAIGNLLPKASLQSITARKYTLPDKTVASQVLMYRQLLHTKCRPGLKLSRPYQETVAQKAVMHMPWWERGIEESKRMVISYDNLITRLWLNGAIEPYKHLANATATANANAKVETTENSDLLSFGSESPSKTAGATDSSASQQEQLLETHITDEGLPPIPHEYWVDRLGFQQPDPVTDFRSGGVLSLAMMVYMVESKPVLCQRFFTGDTAVLPFGITCINVTDMIAKFLMLAKSTDRMDALLSQKPFWKMFADPNAIIAVQELAMSMLCDVAVELGREKKIPYLAEQTNTNEGMPGDANTEVTVFDFSTILERTERRVRDDLLGAGPKTVDELRSIEGRLRLKYKSQMERKIQRAMQKQEIDSGSGEQAAADGSDATSIAIATATATATTSAVHGSIPAASPQFKDAMDKAGNFAGGWFSKVKDRLHQPRETATVVPAAAAESATIVDLPPLGDAPVPAPAFAMAATATTSTTEAPVSGNSVAFSDGDWTGTDIAAATDGIMNFSIGDDDDDDDDLLL